MGQRRKLFLILLQIILWSAFIALPYFLVPHPGPEPRVGGTGHHNSLSADVAQDIFLGSLVYNLFLIAFFYVHHYILFNSFFVSRKIFSYSVSVTAAFIIIFFLSYAVKRFFFTGAYAYHFLFSFREIIRALTWFMLVLLVGLGIKLLGLWRMAEARAREIENEHLRTELSFLHAQINPHFLFNSLNTIYSLSLKKSDSAPNAVLKLSQLLRYVVDEANNSLVPLGREVDYLNNYIELQKLRSTSTVAIQFQVIGDIGKTQLPPMLLLPFVENAFKYGISNQENSPIDIILSVDGQSVNFMVKNRKFSVLGFEEKKDSTGIGIANVQRRLALLYPEKHTLNIDDSIDSYTVNLNIKLA